MKNITNSLNWFEIPVTDFERARNFYSQIYDYDMPVVEMGQSLMDLFPVQSDCIGGAIIKGEGQEPSADGARVYLNGGYDLNEVCERIDSAGGKVPMEKTEISPEHGYYALFQDTEGNHLALHSMK